MVYPQPTINEWLAGGQKIITKSWIRHCALGSTTVHVTLRYVNKILDPPLLTFCFCALRIGCRVGQYAYLLVFAHRYVTTLRYVKLHRYVTLHLLLLLLIVFAHRLQCRSLCLPSFFQSPNIV